METISILTVIFFSIMAATILVFAAIGDEIPKILVYISCIAIIPSVIGLSVITTEVRKLNGCKIKYELVQEPVYRKIK